MIGCVAGSVCEMKAQVSDHVRVLRVFIFDSCGTHFVRDIKKCAQCAHASRPANTAMSNDTHELWRQMDMDAHNRPDTWCKGCGYYRVVHGIHRTDCTSTTKKEANT